MELEKAKEFLERQIYYCECKQKTYKVGNYSKDNRMTNEQMSGYYQGRLEANCMALELLTEFAQQNTTDNEKKLKECLELILNNYYIIKLRSTSSNAEWRRTILASLDRIEKDLNND